jgi:hypothetical protein
LVNVTPAIRHRGRRSEEPLRPGTAHAQPHVVLSAEDDATTVLARNPESLVAVADLGRRSMPFPASMLALVVPLQQIRATRR